MTNLFFHLGASITHTLGEECTYVLVDQLMPLKKDLIDAVVAKKSCVLETWLEVSVIILGFQISLFISLLQTYNQLMKWLLILLFIV